VPTPTRSTPLSARLRGWGGHRAGLLVAGLAAAGLVAGCGAGDKASEAISEAIAEAGLGEGADVNLEDGSVTIETPEGKVSYGEGQSLPEGFPEDVPMADGTVIIGGGRTDVTDGVSFTVDARVDADPAEVFADLVAAYEAEGWTTLSETTATDGGFGGHAQFNKGDTRSLLLGVSEADGETHLAIITGGRTAA
jgi:hypothetical protein